MVRCERRPRRQSRLLRFDHAAARRPATPKELRIHQSSGVEEKHYIS